MGRGLKGVADEKKKKGYIFKRHFLTLVGMKKRRILFSLLGICLSLFLIGRLTKDPGYISQEQKSYIETVLSVLSEEEKKDLKYLFDHFFTFNQFAYPLFGTKPMSIGRLLPTHQTEIGWQAWKKIAPSFMSNKFVIREYIFNKHEFLLIANLDEVEKTYKENKSTFDRAFNGGMTLDALKTCLRDESPLFQELIHDDLIMGILLGYGIGNAQKFSDNNSLSEGKQHSLESFTTGHPLLYFFSPVLPPYFACDINSDETIELKNRYKKERDHIIRMSKSDPLFIHMLALLIKEGR